MRVSIARLAGALAFVMVSAGAASACGFERSADASWDMHLAQTGDAARPARGPQSETSVSPAAPPASTAQPTGATNQPPAVKQMNQEEKQKVEKEGK